MTAEFVSASIESAATGARFTYRVRASEDGRTHFVSVLTGHDNGASYSYIGHIRLLGHFAHGRKSKITEDAPSVKAFTWFWNRFAGKPGTPKPIGLRFYHEGRCCRCARRLTVPASIRAGIGPECAEKVGVAGLWEAIAA